MATIYKIKIKTVSPFMSWDETYMTKMFEKFLRDYKDEMTGMKFESTEVKVEKL